MGRTDSIPTDSLIGVHVLVVDDDRDARNVIKTVLEYCGALVTTARSAREALAILGRVVPDVLVIDIVLPGHDGYWLIEEVRKLPPEKGGAVPALACTGYGDLHTPARLLEAGFREQLRKPIDPWELARLVAALARQG